MKNLIEFPGLGISLELSDGIMIGSFKIAYYGIIISVGVLLAMIYAFYKFRKVGVNPDKAVDCIIGGMIGGIIGARLYFVIFTWELYKDNLWSIFNTRNGGLAIYGGLIGGVLVGILIAKWRKIKVYPLLDVVGIAFLIGQGIGRWGNFFNVEAFGTNTTLPWGMTSPSVVNYLSSKMDYFSSIGLTIDPNMPVHPCFLYESIWCIVGFFILNWYLKRRKFDGEVFLMYLGYYGLGRSVIEGLRTDSLMIGTLRVSQLLAFVLFIACTITIIVVRLKIKGNHDEEYLKLYANTPEGMDIVNSVKPIVDEAISIDDLEVNESKASNVESDAALGDTDSDSEGNDSKHDSKDN